MKRIFLLEDDTTRIRRVRQITIGHYLDVAQTATEAIDILEAITHPYDVISLDHDLGGQQMTPSDKNSGYAVAQYIFNQAESLHPELLPRKIIIHSFNPDGALSMITLLAQHPLLFPVLRRTLFGSPTYWKLLIH